MSIFSWLLNAVIWWIDWLQFQRLFISIYWCEFGHFVERGLCWQWLCGIDHYLPSRRRQQLRCGMLWWIVFVRIYDNPKCSGREHKYIHFVVFCGLFVSIYHGRSWSKFHLRGRYCLFRHGMFYLVTCTLNELRLTSVQMFFGIHESQVVCCRA